MCVLKNCQNFILPCIEQSLADVEDYIIERALETYIALCLVLDFWRWCCGDGAVVVVVVCKWRRSADARQRQSNTDGGTEEMRYDTQCIAHSIAHSIAHRITHTHIVGFGTHS